MPRTITALFHDAAAADRALEGVIASGIARDRIAIVGEDRHPASELAPTRTRPERPSTRQLAQLRLPPEDERLFAEGLRRGHVMVSVGVDDRDTDRCIEVLEMFDPVDLDRRSSEWLSAHGGGSGGTGPGAPLAAGLSAGGQGGQTNTATLPGMGQLTGDGSALGTGDLRTTEAKDAQGTADTTVPVTGDTRAENRAGAPGVGQLSAASPSGGASGGPLDSARRDTSRGGRVRTYTGGEGW